MHSFSHAVPERLRVHRLPRPSPNQSIDSRVSPFIAEQTIYCRSVRFRTPSRPSAVQSTPCTCKSVHRLACQSIYFCADQSIYLRTPFQNAFASIGCPVHSIHFQICPSIRISFRLFLCRPVNLFSHTVPESPRVHPLPRALH